MTKFYDASVKVVLTKTVKVQVSADSDEEAIERAKAQVVAGTPGFKACEVSLRLVAESELQVGSRVEHPLFGAGVIEFLTAISPGPGFRMQIAFDRGDTKQIHGPGKLIRPDLSTPPAADGTKSH